MIFQKTHSLLVIDPCAKYGIPMSKLKKNYGPNMNLHWQTDGQSDGRTDKRTNRQSDYYIPLELRSREVLKSFSLSMNFCISVQWIDMNAWHNRFHLNKRNSTDVHKPLSHLKKKSARRKVNNPTIFGNKILESSLNKSACIWFQNTLFTNRNASMSITGNVINSWVIGLLTVVSNMSNANVA